MRASGGTTHAPVSSAAHFDSSDSSMVVLSQADYDSLRQFEVSQNSQSTTHASFSGITHILPLLKSPRF